MNLIRIREFFCESIFLQIDLKRIFQMSNSRCDHRPSILPDNFGKEGLSSHAAVFFARSGCKHHNIPVTTSIVYQISVSRIDDRIIHSKISMGKNRIARTSLKPLEQLLAARHGDTVFRSGSTFRMEQIIITINLVDMRSLRPYASLDRALPDCHTLSYQLHRL